MRLKPTKVTHKSFNGDIYKARQDMFDTSVWYLELYRNGEQKHSMRLTITADNCNAIFKLLKSEKPTPSENWYKRTRSTTVDIFYKKIMQGGKR